MYTYTFCDTKSSISLRKISKDKNQGYFFSIIMYTYTLRRRGKRANKNDLSGQLCNNRS